MQIVYTFVTPLLSKQYVSPIEKKVVPGDHEANMKLCRLIELSVKCLTILAKETKSGIVRSYRGVIMCLDKSYIYVT